MHPSPNWIEHLTTNQKVTGSNPVGCTKKASIHFVFGLFYFCSPADTVSTYPPVLTRRFKMFLIKGKHERISRDAELNDDIKELLGHEDIKTTQIYSHLTQSSLSNAACLL